MFHSLSIVFRFSRAMRAHTVYRLDERQQNQRAPSSRELARRSRDWRSQSRIARPLSEFVQNFGFAHLLFINRKRRKTAWNKGLTAKFLFWNARWPEKRKPLLKRLSAWYNEGYKKDVRILCVADCRQKAILPPKGENSPFRKWKNSWISWFCYSSQVCLCQQAVAPSLRELSAKLTEGVLQPKIKRKPAKIHANQKKFA